jgi:hypothetical protein
MQEEKYGKRDGIYSAWHRRNSTRRFIGLEKAQLLAMIDVDVSLWLEYDDGTKETLALVETARDVGQSIKPATVLLKLAKRIHPTIPAMICLYTPSTTPNPADEQWPDIEKFRCKRLWPLPENTWTEYTPQQWAEKLLKMREWAADQLDKEVA